MRDGAATLSSKGIILYANRRLAEMLATPRQTIMGSPLSMFLVGEAPVELEQLVDVDGRTATVELELIGDYGVAIPVLVGFSALDLDGDQLICATFTDLSAQKVQELEIARLSQVQSERMAELEKAQAALTERTTHDSLTGVPNRGLVSDRIEHALAGAKRSGQRIAVLFVDLDGFKQINDTRGHVAGDAVLRRVADQMVGSMRAIDTVARVGGDEFVVLAPQVDSHLHAVDIGTRLVTEVSRRRLDGIDAGDRISVSVGLAVSVGGRGSAAILLKEADTAMYRAKSLGGGRVEVFDAALAREVQERSRALWRIQSALDEHRVVIHHQPIIDISSRSIVGFEALARIAEPNGTVLSAADFIPFAEDSPLIFPLGARVIESACQEVTSWLSTKLPQHRLSVTVNLSFRQFAPGDLLTIVQRALGESGLPASCLHLELTEAGIVDLRHDTLNQLEDIRDFGVQIGVDKFGTGSASLIHLRRLPLSFIKIDRSLIRLLGTSQKDDSVVATIVDLAASLGLRSIAGGVETEPQLKVLQKLGCDRAQGFLFGRPQSRTAVGTALTLVDS
jgi:diguanylate cyclase (GGDEF)-like protein